MLVANIKIWKSHLNTREGSDYTWSNSNKLQRNGLTVREPLKNICEISKFTTLKLPYIP